MDLKLVPIMTRLDPDRDVRRAMRFVGMFDGKLSPVVRLFFRIGLHAYETGLYPRDPLALQALLGKGSVEERSEGLPQPKDAPNGPSDPLQCLLCIANSVGVDCSNRPRELAQ